MATRKKARTEAAPPYGADPKARAEEDLVIAQACDIVERRMRRTGDMMTAPAQVRTFISLKLGSREHEVFWRELVAA